MIQFEKAAGILMIFLMVGVIGCNSTPPKKEEPKKLFIGKLCMESLDEGAKKIKKALEKKNLAEAEKLFEALAGQGWKIQKNYVPRMETENLNNFHSQGNKLSTYASEGAAKAKAGDADGAEKALKGIKQSCSNCHLVYKP